MNKDSERFQHSNHTGSGTAANYDLAVISLESEFTIVNVGAIRTHIDELLERGCHQFVLNFEQVDYMDSSGMGLLIYLQKTLDNCGGKLSLVNMSSEIMRTLHYARLLEHLPSAALLFAARAKREDLERRPLSSPGCSSSIKVPKDPARMCEVRAQLTELLQGLSLGERPTFDMVLAVGEALGNAFDHAFGDCVQQIQDEADLQVVVTIHAYEDRVIVEVSDSGKGCVLEEGVLPEMSLTRGRGIRLMHMLSDKVDISPKPHGQGTIVRLVKLRS